jgi:hypothetical protein
MKIRISDSSLGEDLAEFLCGLCCTVERTSEWTLDVRFGDLMPSDDDAARLGLDTYLRVWEAIYPGASAVRVD